MALAILSKRNENSNDVFKDVILASVIAKLRVTLTEDTYHYSEGTDFYDVFIHKKYNDLYDNDYGEHFLLDIHSENFINLNLKLDIGYYNFNEEKYFNIAGTDQDNYDHIIYDFSLAYLRLRPEHIININDNKFFSLTYMEEFEKKGGYFKDWCY